MPGGYDPDCRRTMPWDDIAAGTFDEEMAQVKALIALRRENTAIRGTEIRWHHDPDQPRLVCYDRPGKDGTVRVYINGGQQAVAVGDGGKVCYSRKYQNGTIAPGGILITRL